MTTACIKQIIIALTYLVIVTSFLSNLPAAEAQHTEVNLLSPQTVWKPFAAAIVTQNETSMDILVVNNFTTELWNRAYLPISINSSDIKPMLFSLQYASSSYLGNATFVAEIRDNKTNEILWTGPLDNTSGQFRNQVFVIPDSILNTQVEFRLYIITNGPGEHGMTIKNATIAFSNPTQPIKVETS